MYNRNREDGNAEMIVPTTLQLLLAMRGGTSNEEFLLGCTRVENLRTQRTTVT
jgi:hypothetical protein